MSKYFDQVTFRYIPLNTWLVTATVGSKAIALRIKDMSKISGLEARLYSLYTACCEATVRVHKRTGESSCEACKKPVSFDGRGERLGSISPKDPQGYTVCRDSATVTNWLLKSGIFIDPLEAVVWTEELLARGENFYYSGYNYAEWSGDTDDWLKRGRT